MSKLKKPLILESESGNFYLHWNKDGARLSFYFGFEGSFVEQEDFGWVYVDKSGAMQSGDFPKEMFDAIKMFIDYGEKDIDK